MRHILVKEGAQQPSVFSDFVETVNSHDASPVGFFTRVDPGIRLVRNRTKTQQDHAFALAHYQVDPSLAIQPPSHFQPIDTTLLIEAANNHDFVMVGVVTTSQVVYDYKALSNMTYVCRNAEGHLVDIQTNTRLDVDGRITTFTAFFGFVQMQGFPAYYMILNPNLVHVTDGFDYFESETHTMWTLLTEHDGNLRESLFPAEILNARLIGNTIMTDHAEFDLSILATPTSVFRRESAEQLLVNSTWTATTNLKYAVNGGKFTIQSPPIGQPGFFELAFDCGLFFEQANPHEKLAFKYVVHQYANI